MTTLTEQWQKGELPNGIYYVELLDGDIMIAYMYKMRSCKKIVYRVKTFKGYITKNQMKAVLSELPTYEEWKAQQNYEEHQKKCISIFENKEKQHTDDAIAYNELKESFDLIKSSLYSMTKVWNSTSEDCRTLTKKLLQVKPELRDWLEVNYKENL